MKIKELVEVYRATTRCADEAWKENPRPVRDGTKMVMVPEVIFNRLRDTVSFMQRGLER